MYDNTLMIKKTSSREIVAINLKVYQQKNKPFMKK